MVLIPYEASGLAVELKEQSTTVSSNGYSHTSYIYTLNILSLPIPFNNVRLINKIKFHNSYNYKHIVKETHFIFSIFNENTGEYDK